MKYQTTNAYYFRNLNAIGGIESHLYYIAKKYGKKTDITVFFRSGDTRQILRIKKYARCIQLQENDTVECKNLFCCFNKEIIDRCTAEKRYLVLHGDYEDMVNRGQIPKHSLPIDERIDKYLGVSKTVCESWERITGIKAEFIGEPVVLDYDVKMPLLFCSATRLSVEKGWERMKKLAKTLNLAGVNYTWLIYTNSSKSDIEPNMVMMKPDLNITDKLSMFDAIIQLSDNEGFNLTCVEGLLRGVAFIGTNLPVYKELGLNNENSVLLDSDMNDIPVDEIEKIYLKEFTYTAPADKWMKYLKKVPPTYKYRSVRVIATDYWQKNNLVDRELQIVPPAGYVWEISEERLAELEVYEAAKHVSVVKKVNSGR